MKSNFQKEFIIKNKVWIYSGEMGWYFIHIEKDISKIIRENFPKVSIIK